MSNDSLFMVKTKQPQCAMFLVEVKEMDLTKTGKFIAELRKEKGLTQEQLGEKVGVTNKTVSRWETGQYLPPADVLLMMSELFAVSINELLSGKRLLQEEYKKAAEQNLRQVMETSIFSLKDKIDFCKKKWLKDHAAIMVFIGICILGIFVAGFVMGNAIVSYAAFVLLIVAHGWRNNSMMAYVEAKAYEVSDK